METLSVARSELKENGHPVILFRMLVTPSSKSKDYWHYLCFDEDTGAFLPSPVSCCECPCGRMGCSHEMAGAAVFHLVQKNEQWSMLSDVANALPPPLKSVQSTPTPWIYAFGKSESEKAAKLAEQACLEFEEVSGGTWQSLEETENEDEVLELAASEQADEPGAIQVNVCAQVDAAIAAAEARANVKGRDRTHEHQIDLHAIREANKARPDGVGGPNECVKSKLEQLKVLERLHQARNKLDHSSEASHYVTKTAACRKRNIEQLEHLVKNGMEDRPLNNPKRLAKTPRGKDVLADRGFHTCAHSCPRSNRQITPHFLHGRDQFDIDELVQDEGPKRLRHPSEMNFS